jgi:hypothetical protein
MVCMDQEGVRVNLDAREGGIAHNRMPHAKTAKGAEVIQKNGATFAALA